MTLFRCLLAVQVMVVFAVASIAGCSQKSDLQQFRDQIRVPQYVPEYLERWKTEESSSSDLERGDSPSLRLSWDGRFNPLEYGTGPYLNYRPPNVTLIQIYAQFNMELGEDRRSVEIDGVQGWLTHLDPDDFNPPKTNDQLIVLEEAWPVGATGGQSYSYIMFHRQYPGQFGSTSISGEEDTVQQVKSKTLTTPCDDFKYSEFRAHCIEDPSATNYRLFGEAIALQWSRDGVHYCLIAQNVEPMSVDDLLRMADSMASAESPWPYLS